MIRCRRKGHISRTSLGFQHHFCVHSPAHWTDSPLHAPKADDRGRPSRINFHPFLQLQTAAAGSAVGDVHEGVREFPTECKGP